MQNWKRWMGALRRAPGEDRARLTAEEASARALLERYGCSRRRMAEAGRLEDYLALCVAPELEARWRDDYAGERLAADALTADSLGEAVALAAEYGDARLLARALEAMDEAAVRASVPDEALLGLLLRALRTLEAEGFADAEALLEGRARILELEHRLTARLQATAPEGRWQPVMIALICRLEGATLEGLGER